jgi:hypothetical protein
MNNYTISDDFFLIENSDRKPIKLYYSQLKSIKINYYLTFFQKNFNFYNIEHISNDDKRLIPKS